MQKKSETSKELDGTYYILHNCVHCVYVCLLSEPEKRNICPAGMAEREEWKLCHIKKEGYHR